MKTVKASEFKVKCLKLMDHVAETGETLVITKNGHPVAQLGPVTQLGPVASKPSTLFGLHRGQIRIKGDIVTPLDEAWEAEH